MTSDERISIMEKEHDISSQDLGKVMETMCNPGEGIRKMLWRTDLSKKLQKAAQKLIFYDTAYVSRRNSHTLILNRYRKFIFMRILYEIIIL